MPHLDFYFSPLSPYTYLCGTRPGEIAARHEATIAYKPLDIMGLFARTGGVPPKDRHPNRQAYRLQDMARRAALAGLPLNLKPAFWPTNAAPASYAIIAAQSTGADVAGLIHAFGRAVWAEERNIAEDEVIRDILQAEGFDPALTDSGLLTSAEVFAANLEEAVMKGAFGAPFVITDAGACFWGEDRMADLDAHLSGTI